MKICPMCKGKRFITYALVVQEWVVDECGLCIDVLDDCVDIRESPGEKDYWECYECGFRAQGKEFEVDGLLIKER